MTSSLPPSHEARCERTARLAGADGHSVVLLNHHLSVLCQAEDTE